MLPYWHLSRVFSKDVLYEEAYISTTITSTSDIVKSYLGSKYVFIFFNLAQRNMIFAFSWLVIILFQIKIAGITRE